MKSFEKNILLDKHVTYHIITMYDDDYDDILKLIG